MYIYTTEDLLQFVYNETSPEKSAAIKAALEHDWSLREKMELIQKALSNLEALEMSPRTEAIDKILNYGEKTLSELHTH